MTTKTLTPADQRHELEAGSDNDFCKVLLPKVSRTFAACIELLPSKLADPIRIAYILCRIADTVEDRPDLTADQKKEWLDLLSQALTSLDTIDLIQPVCAAHHQPRNDDEWLVREAARSYRAFFALDPASQQAIRPWVKEMCAGMSSFAQAYPEPSPGDLAALADLAAIDTYCYYVAGTVGHLLTELFKVHLRPTKEQYQDLKKLATSFGLGLQLTNIIKDVADDHQRGWCFVPRELCHKHGIDAEDLLSPNHQEAANQVMQELIGKAANHLDDARRYCQIIPKRAWRARVFCLTPLLFAVATLRRARLDPRLLDPQHKVKITRPQVMKMLRHAWVIAPFNGAIGSYIERLKQGRISLWR